MRAIPGYPGYFATWGGHIYSVRSQKGHAFTKRKLSICPSTGYLFTSVQVNRVRKTLKVHRAVLLAYRGAPIPPKTCCRHLDGNRLNNRLWNLQWGTYKENAEDQVRHGTSPKGNLRPGMPGEKHHMAMLTNVQAAEILAKKGCGLTAKEVARDYIVRPCTVYGIWHRTIWKCLDQQK